MPEFIFTLKDLLHSQSWTTTKTDISVIDIKSDKDKTNIAVELQSIEVINRFRILNKFSEIEKKVRLWKLYIPISKRMKVMKYSTSFQYSERYISQSAMVNDQNRYFDRCHQKWQRRAMIMKEFSRKNRDVNVLVISIKFDNLEQNMQSDCCDCIFHDIWFWASNVSQCRYRATIKWDDQPLPHIEQISRNEREQMKDCRNFTHLSRKKWEWWND